MRQVSVRTHLPKAMGTLMLVFACVLLFLFDAGSSILAPSSSYSSITAFNPIRQSLLFDYPEAIILKDTLIKKEAASTLSAADKSTIDAFTTSSFWGGISLSIFARAAPFPMIPSPSLSLQFFCEKIFQGQIWRLFTPALLHGSLLHLLFNMTWLYVLGRHIEGRVGIGRYFLLICISGLVTNISQYIASGYAFVGFSGILLAMAGFIATRQRLFPTEGYFLEKHLYTFFKIVVFGSALLSLFHFALECYLQRIIFSVGLANTAHISGLFSGILLGKSHLFSPKTA